MGSGEHRLGLVEILRHAYELQEEEEEEESPPGAKSLTELERSGGPTQGGEMPLEELLVLYGYEVSDPTVEHSRQPSEPPACLPDMTLDKDQIAKDLLSGEEEDETPSSADDLTPSVTSHTSDLFDRHLHTRPLADGEKHSTGSASEEDSDGCSVQSNDDSKGIMVGLQYQALIPPLSAYSHQERAYENEDQLLWTPDRLSGEAVEEFLLQAQRRGGEEGGAETPTSGDIIKDNEQALYELVKCSFNAEEALRRLRFNIKVFSEELCAWSEEECRNFEHGYRVHGKNFHLIQANKVRTRSVGECVEYYYMWKKSDRHEYFTQQTTKLGRKKHSLQSEPMEDGEQDGEGVDLEGGGLSHGSPCGPPTPQDPPSPPDADVFRLEEQAAVSPGCCEGAELGGAVSSLRMHPTTTAPQALPIKQPPPPPTQEDHREPVTNCPQGPCCPGPLSAPQAQFCPLQGPCDAPPGPQLLGPGFYRLQLGPFVADGAPGAPGHEREHGPPRRLQVGFSLPAPAPPSPAVAPAASATAEFGALSSFLRPPVQHSRSLTQ
ncbi:mesoderm induction early response protein 2 [Conger conger]|uniref:mesoderm induction early response protein 2 n=1 Tax=Conger conger TaxID=82655 RepID=UPI002A5ADD0E|nr:mesoderm induction early response protein 2 [Conger conger]XP_061096001.1 mesoderm induction early response protein 2 [Conger conger]XP_061096002.1 mesoderm induction early response protein 2 [Conger conger]